jgi:putative transposase
MTKPSPFRYFKTSPEIIRLAVMLYVRFPLSLRNVEDLLHERGIDVSHETIRFWWNRFGPMVAAEIRRKRAQRMRVWPQWQWHLDEVFVKINGETHYLWRAVDHEGEILEAFVSKRRDRKAALKFLEKSMKRNGSPKTIVTDKLRSYGATEGNWNCRSPANRALEEQSSGKLTPAIPTTRTSHAALPADAMFAEIRRCPFVRPQPL